MAHYDYLSSSWVLGSVKVSDEEARQAREIQRASMLGDLGSLPTAWKARLTAIRTESIQDHADLLYTHIAEPLSRNAAGYKELMLERMKTARAEHEVYVDVFTYKHAEPLERLHEKKVRQSTLTAEQLSEEYRKEQRAEDYICHNKLRDALAVSQWRRDEDGELYKGYTLYPEPIHNIVRNSGVMKRLALAFAGTFCYARYVDLRREVNDEHGLIISTKAIRIYYKPFGLQKDQLRATLAFHRALSARPYRILDEARGEALEIACSCTRFCHYCGGDE